MLKSVRFFFGLSLCLLLASCATQPHRARQYSKLFATYPESLQKKLLLGIVEPGYTPMQVYIALGEPQKKVNAGGEFSFKIWIYYGFEDRITTDVGEEVIVYRTKNDLIWADAKGQGYHRIELTFHDDSLIGVDYLEGQ